MSVPLVVCDLDRTLIYSRAALGDAPPPVRCVEVYDGAEASFLTEVAFTLLTRLRMLSVFVPTTTRTVAQLRRVRLPEPASRWAIAANGGHILDRGVSDEDWNAAVCARLERECAPLGEVRAWFAAQADAPWLLRAREADDLFCYAIVDRALLSADVLSGLAGWAAERGWTVSLQGRKLYVVPTPLTKSAAAAEVAVRAGATCT
ncbi:MAG: HAD family hydrolase, partial [Geodermatophilaceae bacterium]|nr:HAD family hydrolase [Geodermatophilaceae bacterium]